jgi:hypothetical protein
MLVQCIFAFSIDLCRETRDTTCLLARNKSPIGRRREVAARPHQFGTAASSTDNSNEEYCFIISRVTANLKVPWRLV